uniref:Abnormal cell migration protein 18-like fibronectin type I domain-containing protein n=1 Tax=Ditylenchus dipsaci TaxID=166011 RepID=A0A915D277_9BILA
MSKLFVYFNCILILLVIDHLVLCEISLDENDGSSSIVLVPHGEDPLSSKDRIVIPQAKDGRQPPLPCIVAETGSHAQTYEHNQTFRKGSFHYRCANGTAEVIACVADDAAVIQISRTFLRNGETYAEYILGRRETVTYEQKSTCFENGIHYDVGDSFRNGSFKLVCKENGVVIEGCYNNSKPEAFCELMDNGKIRYTINLLGCRKGNEMYGEGQIWTDKHIRYQCSNQGTTRRIFVDLGRDVLMSGIVHRCYKLNNTTFYHRFACDEGKSLQECVNESSILPKELFAMSQIV